MDSSIRTWCTRLTKDLLEFQGFPCVWMICNSWLNFLWSFEGARGIGKFCRMKIFVQFDGTIAWVWCCFDEEPNQQPGAAQRAKRLRSRVEWLPLIGMLKNSEKWLASLSWNHRDWDNALKDFTLWLFVSFIGFSSRSSVFSICLVDNYDFLFRWTTRATACWHRSKWKKMFAQS